MPRIKKLKPPLPILDDKDLIGFKNSIGQLDPVLKKIVMNVRKIDFRSTTIKHNLYREVQKFNTKLLGIAGYIKANKEVENIANTMVSVYDDLSNISDSLRRIGSVTAEIHKTDINLARKLQGDVEELNKMLKRIVDLNDDL